MNTVRLIRPLLDRIAVGSLAPRFAKAQVREILDDAYADYEAQQRTLPREASLGGRLMVEGAALTIGLFRALVKSGLPEADARAMTAATTSRVYERMAAFPTVLSRPGARTPHARLKRATDLFRQFPFSAPSYDMVDVEAGTDVVAFDVRRCPVAELFRSCGLADLCVESWCNLDFPLAERWGARLERTTTLAQGAHRCDFRWRVASRRDAPR